MRIYGNLTNRIMETSKNVIPEVGMGATVAHYSDRSAYTIVKVSKDKKEIVVTRDKAVRTDLNEQGYAPMSDDQSYRYEQNPNATPIIFTLRKNGFYVKKGEGFATGTRIIIGVRDEHYDYSF